MNAGNCPLETSRFYSRGCAGAPYRMTVPTAPPLPPSFLLFVFSSLFPLLSVCMHARGHRRALPSVITLYCNSFKTGSFTKLEASLWVGSLAGRLLGPACLPLLPHGIVTCIHNHAQLFAAAVVSGWGFFVQLLLTSL